MCVWLWSLVRVSGLNMWSGYLMHKVCPRSRKNCKYVSLLYLCLDAAINPSWVGVIMIVIIMNAPPIMKRVGS